MSKDKVTQPKIDGGLRIRTMRKANIALFGKHVWNLIRNQDKLCVQLFFSKYLEESSILLWWILSQGHPTLSSPL